MTPHSWVTEEVDGGSLGTGFFWKCPACGASGGPAMPRRVDGKWSYDRKSDSTWVFYADGTGLPLSIDCGESKARIERHLAAMKNWQFPLRHYRRRDIPRGGHPGAFGTQRKHHHHEGIDLYTAEGTEVLAVEPGLVVAVLPFTGPWAGSPWWRETSCVMVEGPSGVVNYGEIAPAVASGSLVEQGSVVGTVRRVLREDKGKPLAMLHLELYRPGTREPVEWPVDQTCPPELWDPDPYLRASRTSP